MQKEYKKQREYLSKLLGVIIKEVRENAKKSISLSANEAEISKSVWADLEKGFKDPQFTTLWRIAETLDVPLSKIILSLEKELPENWSFLDNN